MCYGFYLLDSKVLAVAPSGMGTLRFCFRFSNYVGAQGFEDVKFMRV